MGEMSGKTIEHVIHQQFSVPATTSLNVQSPFKDRPVGIDSINTKVKCVDDEVEGHEVDPLTGLDENINTNAGCVLEQDDRVEGHEEDPANGNDDGITRPTVSKTVTVALPEKTDPIFPPFPFQDP